MKILPFFCTIVWSVTAVACVSGNHAAQQQESKALPTLADHLPAFSANGVSYLGNRDSEGSVDAFLGIPFAQAPVGQRRWMPPAALQPSQTRQGPGQSESRSTSQVSAQEFAAACMQGPHMVEWYRGVISSFGGDPESFPAPAFSEDCLYLNIWRPRLDDRPGEAEALPVLVFIHGGSNKGGWSFEPNYIGEQMASRGVIVVTLAYRVGIFGFFAHPQLEHTNFALLDQIAALDWIQDNVAALGGDPTKVTVIGESAGANNIEFLMASPLATGLFQRVIHQSGGSSQLDRVNRTESDELGRQLAGKVLGPGSADNVGDLRKVPAQTILDAVTEVYRDYYFDPVVDGYSVIMPLGDVVKQGKIAKVDLLIGSNADEWTIYLDPAETVDGWLGKNVTEQDARALRQILDSDNVHKHDSPAKHLDRLITAQNFVCPSLRLAEAVSAVGGRSWVFYFSKVRTGELAASMGAYHGAELPYVFNTHDDWLPTDAADRALTEAIMTYWVQFVKTGNPNVAGMPPWPGYTRPDNMVQELDATIKSAPHLSQKLCDILMPREPGRP